MIYVNSLLLIFPKDQNNILSDNIKELYEHYSVIFIDGCLVSEDIIEEGFFNKKK